MVKKLNKKIKRIDRSQGFDIYSLFKKKPKKIHPSQLAQVIDRIPLEHAPRVFNDLETHVQLEVFPYLETSVQHKLARHIAKPEISNLLNKLSSDDRTAFFEDLMTLEQALFLKYLSLEKRKETQQFLGYSEDSVARLIDTDFATVSKDMTIKEVREHIRKNFKDTEAMNVIYVVDDEGRLIDDIPVRKLILHHSDSLVSDLMDEDFVMLRMGDTQDKAIETFKDYDRIVMPVVNEDGVLMGVVTIDDIMDLVEQQQTEDIQKMWGVEALDFPYVKTKLLRLTEKRATWLIILFIGEMLTATAMGYFEEEIAAAVVLALFVPLVISSGGNSGSQAATLIIRALAVKELSLRDWWFVMRREILSGFILGTILGTIGFLRISLWEYLWWYDYGEYWFLIALTIFLSLIWIVLRWTLSWAMIPFILKRLGRDPATSSAPFVATMVDVTGLIIYFSIAAVVLKGTLL